jgi:YidC/Oxa1 family membrane protein insertase
VVHAADLLGDVLLLPGGSVLYWITNNVLSIAQQWIINTRMGVPPKFNLPKF